MKVKVKFFAYLRDVFHGKEKGIEFKTRTTVGELLNLISDFPEGRKELFKGSELKPHLVIFKNGTPVHTKRGLETELQDGDTINIFPFIGGG
ncbi:MAG: MoaD/ThiS family protein [Candidatus Aminicenantes bacterium]|nr:MoaD/ThiS family protein [Candidatus Aminicenantes bacterium]